MFTAAEWSLYSPAAPGHFFNFYLHELICINVTCVWAVAWYPLLISIVLCGRTPSSLVTKITVQFCLRSMS